MKTVLITGGSRGIGAAIVRKFAGENWNVIFTYLGSFEAAVALSNETGARAVRSDVGDEAAIMDLFTSLDDAGIPVDALVNNAGVTGDKRRLVELDSKVLDHLYMVNFAGPVLMCREAVKRMSKATGGNGGTIVNISSTAVNKGSPGQWVDYAALKGGLDTFTRGLAREVGLEGIRVNAVAPGYVMTDPEHEEEIQARFELNAHEVPLGRIGSVEEIAEAVYWLCQDTSAYVTGTIFPVAGGR